jgi:hypothetical protein
MTQIKRRQTREMASKVRHEAPGRSWLALGLMILGLLLLSDSHERR